MKRRGHSLRHRGESHWTSELASLKSTSADATFLEESSAFLNLGAAATGSSLFSELEAFPSSDSSVFGYSQKNFHISDGNLYSVLSPFQARKPNARPSFLRGQSCVTSVLDSSTTQRPRHAETGKSRPGTSSWFDEPPPPPPPGPPSTTRHADRKSSLLSKRLKSQREELDEEEFFRDEWESVRSSFHKSHHHRLDRRSDGVWSFDDEKEEEGRAPLNLCLADRRKRLGSSSLRLARDDFLQFDRRHHERRFSLVSSLLDDLSSPRSSRFSADPVTRTSHRDEQQQDVLEEEPQVLDLSMKNACPRRRHQERPPASSAATKCPQISEMFRNMKLQDDDGSGGAAIRRYNATRQLLMHTHPEMFVHDWDRTRGASGPPSSEVPHKPRRNWGEVPPPPSAAAPVRFPEGSTAEASCPASTLTVPTPAETNPQLLPPLVPSASYTLVQQTQRQLQHQQMRSASAPSIGGGPSSPSSSQRTAANDISICKFKLIKGEHPVLEEKKSFFVTMPRSSQTKEDVSSCSAAPSSSPFFAPPPSASTSGSAPAAAVGDKFRAFKIHLGSQEEMGRRLRQQQRPRRRSRKALAREKLEATFREQGFLIKTQQVSSAEGAVYCKFRQLRKFTRYLFKSWKDYLPKELDDLATAARRPPVTT